MTAIRFIRIITFALALTVIGLAWGARVNAQEPDPEKLEEGAQLFAENCAICHGADGKGRIGATLNQDWPSIRPDLTVKNAIVNGINGSVMPAWSQAKGGPLTDSQIEALVVYILNWQTGGYPQVTPLPTATLLPPITPVPEVDGDPNRGAQLFVTNCVVCHGEQGEGRVGATLAKEWPGIRPDLSVQSAIANGLRGTKMPAWSISNGGPLTDEQIQDLTSFILTLPKVEMVEPQTTIETDQTSWLSGWGGVVLFVVLLAVIILGVIYFQQSRQTNSSK